MLKYVFMLLFKGCRFWTSSSFLGWEDTQGRGKQPYMSFYRHLLHRNLCSLKPSFCLCCKAKANTPLLPKIMAVFPPALPKLSYTSRSLGTLPPCSHCISSLHFRCSFSIKLFPFAGVPYSVFSILNSCLGKLQLCSLENQTEMYTCAYRNSDKTSICSSTWQRHHWFSLAFFILPGQESPECFLVTKRRKGAFLWSNLLISDSGDLEALCLWLPCQIILIFSELQLSAATECDKPEQSAGALWPLSDALPLYHHHLRPFPPRAVSRLLLS